MKSPKVFGLGFQKTGTSSLGQALSILGYKVCGYLPFNDLRTYEKQDVWDIVKARADELSEQHDAFEDTPWPLLYEEMDRKHPGSKFILVTRETEGWIKSVVKDFGPWPNAIHKHIYGVPYPKGYEEIWIERYQRHNEEVLNYFSGRPNFVHLRLDSGEVNWENLCGFLGCDVPEQPWPYINKYGAKQRRMFLYRQKEKIKKILKPFSGRQ